MQDLIDKIISQDETTRETFEQIMLQKVAEKLTESVDHVVRKIAGQTDDNDHVGAIKTLAKHLGDKEAHKELSDIHDRHVKRGHMNTEDDDRTNEIRRKLLNSIKNSEDRKKFHGAF